MPMIKDQVKFLAAWARNPKKVGAIAPSSPALCRLLAKNLSLKNDEVVIEFGPGTGPLAKVLCESGLEPSRYLGIERNTDFVRHLNKRFPQFSFVAGSAEDVHDILKQRDICHTRIRAVLSGLPFASLPPSVQDNIISALDDLIQPGCVFRTFQYVHAYPLPAAIRFRKRMNALFGPVKRSRAVLMNLPPAYVLSWSR